MFVLLLPAPVVAQVLVNDPLACLPSPYEIEGDSDEDLDDLLFGADIPSGAELQFEDAIS